MASSDHRSISPLTLFGLLVGGGFIVASLLFILSGKDAAMDPRLGNVVSGLTIIGCFMGVKKYRDDRLGGIISYGQAFGAGLRVLLLAALLYTVYTYFLYARTPDLLERYREVSAIVMKEIYGNTPFGAATVEMSKAITPGMVAFGEFLRDVVFGMFFLLVIAAILRRTTARTHPSHPAA